MESVQLSLNDMEMMAIKPMNVPASDQEQAKIAKEDTVEATTQQDGAQQEDSFRE